jgi:hypothetical protein
VKRFVLTLALALSFGFAEGASLSTPDLTCRVRGARNNVVRSTARRRLFLVLTGYPKGREGYIVDHLVPLACGGCDVPSNMSWLTRSEWSVKTKWERKPCSAWFDGMNTAALQRGRDR